MGQLRLTPKLRTHGVSFRIDRGRRSANHPFTGAQALITLERDTLGRDNPTLLNYQQQDPLDLVEIMPPDILARTEAVEVDIGRNLRANLRWPGYFPITVLDRDSDETSPPSPFTLRVRDINWFLDRHSQYVVIYHLTN